MQVQGGGPREELIDYLPPKKNATRIIHKVSAQKHAGEEERNRCWGGWSGRSQGAQNVSCEGCEEQIRAVPEAGSRRSRAG